MHVYIRLSNFSPKLRSAVGLFIFRPPTHLVLSPLNLRTRCHDSRSCGVFVFSCTSVLSCIHAYTLCSLGDSWSGLLLYVFFEMYFIFCCSLGNACTHDWKFVILTILFFFSLVACNFHDTACLDLALYLGCAFTCRLNGIAHLLFALWLALFICV